ncbi:hypothetical protein N2152v2_000519 [Parachlorella kessleri]
MVQCEGTDWRTRTCKVKNLYVAGLMAVFVAQDANMSLPELRLWEYADTDGKDPTRPAIPLSQLLHVVDQSEAAALFAGRLAQGPVKAATATRRGKGSMVRGGPVDQGAENTAAVGSAEGYTALDRVVALQPFLLKNWWHTMDDVSVTAFRFCKYFGQCRFEDMHPAASGVVFINAQPFFDIPGPAIEAFSCYGSLLRLEQLPQDRLPHEAARSLVVISETLFGVGDEITHPYTAESLHLRRANDTMRLRQIELLRQCVGLPVEGTSRMVPNLRIVNREYGAGRSFLGLAEVLAVLDKRRPPGLQFNIEVVYPTGFNFTQQAQLFDSTDILVIGHGAAAGTMVFLPRRAVVLNLAALDMHRLQETSVVQGLPRPAFNVTYTKIFGDFYTDPIVDKLRTHEGFLALPPQDQAHLLLHPHKNDPRTQRIVHHLFPDWHWAMFYFNIRPPTDVMVTELLDAVRLWYSKHSH